MQGFQLHVHILTRVYRSDPFHVFNSPEQLFASQRIDRVMTMKCSYCREHAGWFTRVCADCRRLLDIYKKHEGQIGPLQFFDLFIGTGLPREKIEAFLAADPRGEGSVKDRILADMSTELLGAMGVRAPQSAHDVKRLREKGEWQHLGERPKE